jgi:DNA repair photolyase
VSVSGRKDPGQRALCLCARAKDIGAPNTCLFGCTYCYATKSIEVARKNFTRHDPTSAALIGTPESFTPQTKKKTGQHELF